MASLDARAAPACGLLGLRSLDLNPGKLKLAAGALRGRPSGMGDTS